MHLKYQRDKKELANRQAQLIDNEIVLRETLKKYEKNYEEHILVLV
jgi:hypothetical protein